MFRTRCGLEQDSGGLEQDSGGLETDSRRTKTDPSRTAADGGGPRDGLWQTAAGPWFEPGGPQTDAAGPPRTKPKSSSQVPSAGQQPAAGSLHRCCALAAKNKLVGILLARHRQKNWWAAHNIVKTKCSPHRVCHLGSRSPSYPSTAGFARKRSTRNEEHSRSDAGRPPPSAPPRPRAHAPPQPQATTAA